jgi:hypothetical protein
LDGHPTLTDDDSVEIGSLANQIEATELRNDFLAGPFMNPKHPTNRMPAMIPMMEISPEEATNLVATKKI